MLSATDDQLRAGNKTSIQIISPCFFFFFFFFFYFFSFFFLSFRRCPAHLCFRMRNSGVGERKEWPCVSGTRCPVNSRSDAVCQPTRFIGSRAWLASCRDPESSLEKCEQKCRRAKDFEAALATDGLLRASCAVNELDRSDEPQTGV